MNAANVSLHHSNFAGITKILGMEKVDAVLADLGVASPQIDDLARGFSYREEGPLDMRMDSSRGQTAEDVVNRMREEELAKLLWELGDEEDASEIARLVVERRAEKRIEKTSELMGIVCEAMSHGIKLRSSVRTWTMPIASTMPSTAPSAKPSKVEESVTEPWKTRLRGDDTGISTVEVHSAATI